MRLHIPLLLAVTTISVSAFAQAVPNGIPRSLARERAARVSGLQYSLHFSLVPHAPTTQGSESLTFALNNASEPLLLDYRDGHLDSLTLNGHALPPEIDHGHLVLPAKDLIEGRNTIEAKFESHVAPAEKAIISYQDHDDGSEYIYTLFVPMDASMAFPCFDQPDLKGRFQLTLDAPAKWTVISNTNPLIARALPDQRRETTFAVTEPLPTYLVAFAAGPFVKVHPVPGLPGLYVRKSRAAAAAAVAPQVQELAAAGIRYLSHYFHQPFPFPKYDMVLIPGFAYGGMEHAGATFLKEDEILFRSAPTETNRVNRDIVVLHELTHQWFGDFTTMTWFDDLWLKEGFAQYMAYQSLSALQQKQESSMTGSTASSQSSLLPVTGLHADTNVWKYFYQTIKPAAYGIDETRGTTPIYQSIPNLDDAKSAYGAIVYSKAPGVLKQLAFVLGQKAFRKGLQDYLASHPYGNADWNDLIQSLQTASGKNLQAWADLWIRHRGMPEVHVKWSCSDGKIASFTLNQQDVLGTDTVWPIATNVLLGYPSGHNITLRAQWSAASAPLPQALGKACPAYVFANAGDQAYGLFLLDPRSREFVTAHLDPTDSTIPGGLEQAMLWGSLWQSVRLTEYDPNQYLQLALRDLPDEHDELLTSSVLARSEWALHHYVGPQTRQQLVPRFAALAVQRMQHDTNPDLRTVWFRSLPGLAQQQPGRDAVKSLLAGKLQIPGVKLRVSDRWNLITALIAYGDPQAETFLKAEQKRDTPDEASRYAYIARAAVPTAANKRYYFSDYLHNPRRPEDWISSSLGAFNYWNESSLTEPYIQPALEALPQIKQTRKIFFLVTWLDAFLGNQTSAVADRRVHEYLAMAPISPDLRLKILQAVDTLDRTVAIRAKYGAK